MDKRAIVTYRVKKFIKNNFRVFFLIFLNLFAWTQIGEAVQVSFCFHRSVNLPDAMKEANYLLLEGETSFFQSDVDCISGGLRSERRIELFEKALNRKYPISRTLGELTQGSGEHLPPCQITFEAKSLGHEQGREFALGKKNRARANQKNQEKSQTISLNVTPGMPGKISFGGEELEVICRPQGAGQVELSFSRRNGDVAVASSVSVTRGQSFHLGAIDQNQNNQDKSIDISRGGELKNKESVSNVSYNVTVK